MFDFVAMLPVFLILCIYVHYVHTWFLRKSEEGIRSGIKVTDSCDKPYWYWEPNPGPLQEWQMLLPAELSL